MRPTRPDSEVFFFHMHCLLHVVSLIRKPLVLGLPGFWTSLVRFSHLSRNFSWRRKFLTALAHVITQSFQCVFVPQLPQEVLDWQARMHNILHSNISIDGKRKIAMFSKLLTLDNSCPDSEIITHYCIPSCRHCVNSALTETLLAYLSLFASFFDVPLLARWKHYGPAIDYVRRGFALHNLLPRVLKQMSRGSSSCDMHDAVKTFLRDSFDKARLPETELQDLLEIDPNHSQDNAKRQQKLFEVWTRPHFLTHAQILDQIVKPLDVFMDALFHRTSDVHKLTSATGISDGGNCNRFRFVRVVLWFDIIYCTVRIIQYAKYMNILKVLIL